MSAFDGEKWIEDKKLELINLMFNNEFGIQDFRNSSKIINFDDLQTEIIKDRVNKYRVAMGALFKAEEIRSVLDYYYLQQDKKPVLNLLKQILKYYGFEFARTSEYQGNYGGKKVYKSRYTIVATKKLNDGSKKADIEEDDENLNEPIDIADDGQKNKKKVISKLVKTYKIDLSANKKDE